MAAVIECVVAGGNTLGEGPVWDSRSGVLYWIDILESTLHSYAPIGGSERAWTLPAQPGAVACRAGGGLLVGLASGLAAFDPQSGEVSFVMDPEPDRPGNRLNDGATDRRGRFWFGSMGDPEGDRTGALYRYDPDGGCHRVLDGIGIPNSLAFSPAGDVMYFTDSRDRAIYAFDYDQETGVPSNRRVFAETPDCIPDGSTVDADGFLWNAQWGGWRVVRYAPDGTVDRVVEMPVENPTCCAFGGEDLDLLFVTSASAGAGDRQTQPQAGGLFVVDVEVAGVAGTPAAG